MIFVPDVDSKTKEEKLFKKPTKVSMFLIILGFVMIIVPSILTAYSNSELIDMLIAFTAVWGAICIFLGLKDSWILDDYDWNKDDENKGH